MHFLRTAKATIFLLINLFLLSHSIASDADKSPNSHNNDIFVCFNQEHKDIIDSCFKSSFPVRCEELRDNAPWFTGESISAGGKYVCIQGVIYGAAALALSYAFGTDISTTAVMAPFIVNKVRLATIIAMEELRTGNRTDKLEVGRRIFTYMVPWKVWAPLGAATQALSGMSVLDAFSEYPEIPFAGHLCQLFLEAKNINDEHIKSDAKNIIAAQGTTLFHFKTSAKDSPCAVKLHALKHENCILLRCEQVSTDEHSVSVVKFKDRIGQPDCRICLETFSDTHKTVVVGFCNHLFCLECFDAVMTPKSETLLGSQSFRKKPFLCPLCRNESIYLFVFDAKNIVHESAVDK